MFKKINQSFTIEEVLLGLFIFLIVLGTIISSYLGIVNTHLITNNQLLALQNLKTALDRIYHELKFSENISTTTQGIMFISTQDCATKTIVFASSPENIGYLALIKDNTTITLTDLDLIDIKNFNINLWGILNPATPTINIFGQPHYRISSTKAVTLSIEANSLLTKGLHIPFNLQLTVQPFNSFTGIPDCYFQ